MAKKRIEIVACTESYQNLSSFDSIEQLNETVRAYKEKLQGMLNKTELAVLDLLHRYSAKYKGVSFLTKNHIAELVGRKRRTIIYICNRLEELGVIKQLETKRTSDMRQTSNAIVIQPIQEEKVADQEENCTQETENIAHQKDNTSLKQLHNINHLNITSKSARKAYIKLVPKRLQHFQAFFGKEVKTLYARIWLTTKKLGVTIDKAIMQEIAHITFSKLVEYLKEGRTLTTEQMHKIAYTIAFNQLQEREDTKDEVFAQKALNMLKTPVKPQESELTSYMRSIFGTN
ncbi:helix-turn-helix domain-containing protein [Priestia megaterium]|uniref:helix-turn-helix domain-containing protein n=1 Tax=Priestia megaterium TaxID=1404 RepID=UPI001ADF3310|nr:helix-turn-helix domain-containing protein [Priestia megaterium]